MTIAKRLSELMHEKRVKQIEMAKRLEIPQSTLATWLSRGEDFPAQYVIPICKVLGVSPEMLLEGSDVPLALIPEDYMQVTEEERFLLETLRGLERGVSVLCKVTSRSMAASDEAKRRWGFFALLEREDEG